MVKRIVKSGPFFIAFKNIVFINELKRKRNETFTKHNWTHKPVNQLVYKNAYISRNLGISDSINL
jgi:hypothetical protein